MKVSTYGLWELTRQTLVTELLNDPNISCRKEEIDNALLSSVFTKYGEASMSAYGKLSKDESIDKATIPYLAIEKGLEVVLLALSEALKIEPELLEAAVNKYKENYLSVAKRYLPTFMEHCMPVRNKYMQKLLEAAYGHDFEQKYGEQGLKWTILYLNDPKLIQQVAEKVTTRMVETAPKDHIEAIQAHVAYIDEVAKQMMPVDKFKEKFKMVTGVTQDEFKAQIKRERLLPKTVYHNMEKFGLFKVQAEIRQRPSEVNSKQEMNQAKSWNPAI